MTLSLSRDEILAKCKRTHTTVPLPSGGVVCIQSLSEKERSEYEAAILDDRGRVTRDGLAQARRRLIALSLVDDDGKVLFDSNGDLDTLAQLNAADADAIYAASREHSGFDREDIEDAAKNSEGARGDG